MTVQNLVYKMLTTSTGAAICDSGGAYGRHWERNAKKSIDDFENEPSATIEVYKWERNGVISYDLTPCLSLYHHLKNALDLDDLCNEFNALPVEDWRGDYYGVSDYGMEWLENNGFKPYDKTDGFNSYNWSANFSQVVQGQYLTDDSGELYVLLQIHQGCDVRGGYTDAKLFKVLSEYGFLTENCGFCADLPNGEYLALDWLGEWVDREGSMPTDDYIKQFCEALGEGVHAGEMFEIN